MAKNPEVVRKFSEGLAKKLQPIWEKEREELLKMKEEEVTLSLQFKLRKICHILCIKYFTCL